MPPLLCLFSPQVLLTSMEEEVAAAQARRSLLDLFLVPKLRWRSCSMFLVRCVAAVLVPPRAGAGAGGRRCRCGRPMGWDPWRPAARAQGLGRCKNSPKTEQKT